MLIVKHELASEMLEVLESNQDEASIG